MDVDITSGEGYYSVSMTLWGLDSKFETIGSGIYIISILTISVINAPFVTHVE
jgi:hypothetical protein